MAEMPSEENAEQKIDLTWTPFLSLLTKEIRRFLRVIAQTLLIPLINSFLYLLIFGVSLGKNIVVSPEYSYLAFLIPGLVMMAVLNNAFQNTSSSIGTSKFHGDLEDLRMVPLSAWQIVLAFGAGGTVRGFLVGIITFTVGEAFYYYAFSAWLGIRHPVALLGFLMVGGMAFSLLGIIVAFRAKNIDQLSAVGGFILLPLLYLGGVFFPLKNLHPIWQSVSRFNPMIYFINGVRYGILGTSDLDWTWSAGFSLLTLVVMYAGAITTVKRGPYARW